MITDGNFTLVDYDFHTGRSVWHYFDGEKTIIRTDYPVDNLVRENAAFRNHVKQGGDWRKVASIPMNILYDNNLARAHSEGDDKYVLRFLNDSDNRAWRTSTSRL